MARRVREQGDAQSVVGDASEPAVERGRDSHEHGGPVQGQGGQGSGSSHADTDTLYTYRYARRGRCRWPGRTLEGGGPWEGGGRQAGRKGAVGGPAGEIGVAPAVVAVQLVVRRGRYQLRTRYAAGLPRYWMRWRPAWRKETPP